MATSAPALDPSSLPVTRATKLRHLANWCNLSTPLGLGIAAAGGARIRRGPALSLLADHYRWRFPTGGAFTVGDVIISRHDLNRLVVSRPNLLQHELVHSTQWAVSLGLPFLPMYVASMGWSWLRTGDRAARCVFERHAGLADGGYADVPPRPLGPVVRAGAARLVAAARAGTTSGARVGSRA